MKREPNSADEWPAFIQPVAIRTAGDEQSILFGDLQIMFRRGFGMFRVKTFDAVQTRFHQTGMT